MITMLFAVALGATQPYSLMGMTVDATETDFRAAQPSSECIDIDTGRVCVVETTLGELPAKLSMTWRDGQATMVALDFDPLHYISVRTAIGERYGAPDEVQSDYERWLWMSDGQALAVRDDGKAVISRTPKAPDRRSAAQRALYQRLEMLIAEELTP